MRWEDSVHERRLVMGLFLSVTLSQIWFKCWVNFYGFVHNSLVSRPFLIRKVLDRSSRYALLNGQRVVNQILLLAWSWSWSNFGQTWSTLVKPSRTLRNVLPTMFWESFDVIEPLLGRTRLNPSCLVLRADTRENPGGKNKVMAIITCE